MRGTRSSDDRPDVELALQMVRTSEDFCNLGDLDAVVMSNSIDCQWRSGAQFIWGREQIRAHLAQRWRRHMDRRVITELWAAHGDRISLRYLAEFHDESGVWTRTHGSEHWELNIGGLVRRRFINSSEQPIAAHERVLRWPAGVRPDEHPGLSELGL